MKPECDTGIGRTTGRRKAVALCWLFHLVGDVHQPLHTAALFTTEYPDGDRGGNLIYVRAGPRSGILNLHQLWDDLHLGTGGFRTRDVATELRLRPAFARAGPTPMRGGR